jgi:hypothetical protein
MCRNTAQVFYKGAAMLDYDKWEPTLRYPMRWKRGVKPPKASPPSLPRLDHVSHQHSHTKPSHNSPLTPTLSQQPSHNKPSHTNPLTQTL